LLLKPRGPPCRVCLSHSSKDNVEALAFRRWLAANGWAESEVFIDVHGIGAGARWRETLRRQTQMLPPLSPTAYRDVITKPAEVYTGRVRRLVVEPALADKLALDATGGDALPLFAFTLEKLFEKFGIDGNLTLQRYESIKGFGGSIDTMAVTLFG
jgi:hypothetical protein